MRRSRITMTVVDAKVLKAMLEAGISKDWNRKESETWSRFKKAIEQPGTTTAELAASCVAAARIAKRKAAK